MFNLKRAKNREHIPIVKRSLFSWAFSGQLKLQLALLVFIGLVVVVRVLPLEMQKRIINDAIRMKNFEMLLGYCGIYLASVASASGLKFAINYLQTLIGQRAMTDMRKELYHHILTLPMVFFRKTQPGMVVSSLVTELNTAGSFAGMALAVPLSSILTLIAFACYLLWLHPVLAMVTLSIYPIVVCVIPKLQKGANKANKQRVDVSRDLSSRIAETISGIHEVQGHGAFRIENRKFDDLVERLLKIRIVWSLWRFGVKVANNFFISLGPFVVFLLGGYFVMDGSLELGAMVAFLSAQEKLYDPWKELIEFYQVYQDASVRYVRTMEYFDVEPEILLDYDEMNANNRRGEIEVKNVSFVTDDGITLIDNISLSLQAGEHLALVGFSGSGKSTLAYCIGQLYRQSRGQVIIDGKDVTEMSKNELVKNVGIVAQSPFVFTGSIEENLLYAHGAAAGVDSLDSNTIGMPDLDFRIEALQQAGIFVDVLRFGMNTVLPENRRDEYKVLLRVRENFQENFGDLLKRDVEFYSEERFLYFSSIAENLIFGVPLQKKLDFSYLANNSEFCKFLKQANLHELLVALGRELICETVDLLVGLEKDEVFFKQSPINYDEFPEYQNICCRLRSSEVKPTDDEQFKLLTVGLRYTPGIHKMTTLSKHLEELVMLGRTAFKQWCNQAVPGGVAFYDQDKYIPSQSILNNVFFGKLKNETPQSRDRITQSLVQLLIAEDILEYIAKIGMGFHVGSKGDKLSGGQRQKLAIARVFLKRPKVIIMDEATSALDNKSQTRIQNLLARRYKGKNTVIAVAHRLDSISSFDRVAVMKAGRLVEIGPYDELIAREGVLYELVHGRKANA